MLFVPSPCGEDGEDLHGDRGNMVRPTGHLAGHLVTHTHKISTTKKHDLRLKMQAIQATLTIKPSKTREFEELFASGAALVHANEPDCLLYQLCKARNKPVYTVLEIYRNKSAVQTHMKNLKKNANPAMASLLAGKSIISMLEVVGNPGLKAGTPTIGIVASMPAKNVDALVRATVPVLDDVQAKEDGNLMYCLCKDAKGEKIVFLELYTDMAAVGHHGKTEGFKAMGKRQRPYLRGKPHISFLETVGVGGIQPTAKM